jgi:hypothetical protein
MTTAKAVATYAARQGIQIEDEGRGIYRTIGAYSPEGYVFAATDTHFIGCHSGDDGKVDWQHVRTQLELMPCPDGEDCDMCKGEG